MNKTLVTLLKEILKIIILSNLKPIYHEASRLLKEDPELKTDKPVVLAKVDATSATSIAARFNINSYPTLKIIRNAEASDYEGPRKEAKGF